MSLLANLSVLDQSQKLGNNKLVKFCHDQDITAKYQVSTKNISIACSFHCKSSSHVFDVCVQYILVCIKRHIMFQDFLKILIEYSKKHTQTMHIV